MRIRKSFVGVSALLFAAALTLSAQSDNKHDFGIARFTDPVAHKKHAQFLGHNQHVKRGDTIHFQTDGCKLHFDADHPSTPDGLFASTPESGSDVTATVGKKKGKFQLNASCDDEDGTAIPLEGHSPPVVIVD